MKISRIFRQLVWMSSSSQADTIPQQVEVNDLKHALVHITYKTDHCTFCYSHTTQKITKMLHTAKKRINSIDKFHKQQPSPCREGIQKITALAITDSWASGRPWWSRSLSRYILCAHCDRTNWICESVIKLHWKITPNSLQQSNCSILSRTGGIWKYCTLGRLNTVSF